MGLQASAYAPALMTRQTDNEHPLALTSVREVTVLGFRAVVATSCDCLLGIRAEDWPIDAEG